LPHIILPHIEAIAPYSNYGSALLLEMHTPYYTLSVEDIRAVYGSGDSWLLFKRNEKEAVVRIYYIFPMLPLCYYKYKPLLCPHLFFFRLEVYGSGDSWLLFKRNEKEAVVRVDCSVL